MIPGSRGNPQGLQVAASSSLVFQVGLSSMEKANTSFKYVCMSRVRGQFQTKVGRGSSLLANSGVRSGAGSQR